MMIFGTALRLRRARKLVAVSLLTLPLVSYAQTQPRNVLAGAESTEGVSKSAVACGTTGVLEDRILETIRLKIRVSREW